MVDFTIREVDLQDLDDIASVHVSSFYDRALSQLGFGAVKRYYHWLLTSFPSSYPICAVATDNKIVGFCFTGVYAGSTSGFLKKYKWYLLSRVLLRPWLLFNSIVREQVFLTFRTFKKLLKKRKQKSKPSLLLNEAVPGSVLRPKIWGILSIAVDPIFQRQGVAEAMMRYIECLLMKKGIDKLYLSVHTDNKPAVSLYEKMGWEKTSSNGNWQGSMIKWLD